VHRYTPNMTFQTPKAGQLKPGTRLRHYKTPKLSITWDKDRGKNVESASWFKVFKGDHINDHDLTRAERESARAKGSGS
jgi:hypothetical protein